MSYFSRPDPAVSKQWWSTIDWVRDNIPAGTVIGVRDYGRISLFTSARIQDLAGNIDPPVSEALQNGTLREYLKNKHVEYLMIPTLEQRSDKLYQYLHKNLKLELVKEASTSAPFYKIIW